MTTDSRNPSRSTRPPRSERREKALTDYSVELAITRIAFYLSVLEAHLKRYESRLVAAKHGEIPLGDEQESC